MAAAWTLAAVLGLGLGGFVLHFPGSYGEPEASVIAAVFGLLIGGVNGVLVGMLLWVVTRVARPAGLSLAAAMAAAVGATHALFDGSSTTVLYVVVAALGGLAMGVATGCLPGLGRRDGIGSGIAWVVALIVAAGIDRVLGLPFSETPVGWSMQHAIYGAVAGLIWGGATAFLGIPARVHAGRPRPTRPARRTPS